MRENIARSSAKSKELISVLNNSGDWFSSDYVLDFSNSIYRSFINKLKKIALRIPPCLSPIDVLNGVEITVYITVVRKRNVSPAIYRSF